MDHTVFRTILASMGEGIVFADHKDRIRFVNAAAEAIRNIRACNYVGRHLLKTHSPRAANRIEKLLEGLKSREIPFATRTIQVKGKSFENSYYPIRTGHGHYVGTLMVSRDITEKNRLREENLRLREQVQAGQEFAGMVGKSAAMQPVFQTIMAAAGLDSTVLITGENGTGKELVARALHRQSGRKKAPLVNINCAALPENLLEAELFGHEKGAFTGASQARPGKFEQASGGTLFLDEIGEMSLPAQTKLLRVLQEKKVERIGGAREIPVDVRIVAATNRDLRREMEAGRFRQDLFYRLNVIPVHLPPLRERREDILALAELFLAQFSAAMNKPLKRMTKEATQTLLRYPYPGNVRELKNALERSVALGQGDELTTADLPEEMTGSALSSQAAWPPLSQNAEGLAERMQAVEKQLVAEALSLSGGKKAEAAKILGISRKTLWEKLRKWEMP
ncbi:sigma-54 interaction domain-containing protein [Desulfuromonas versatilis]|nr:sigma 54-interacting transcriptional regulator [Desulfuromonas versatilis]